MYGIAGSQMERRADFWLHFIYIAVCAFISIIYLFITSIFGTFYGVDT